MTNENTGGATVTEVDARTGVRREVSVEGGLPDGADGDDSGGRQYVGFWARVGAFIIDLIVVYLPVGTPVVLLIYGIDVFETDDPEDSPLDILIYISQAIATIAFWRWKGATPGKMIIGAKIVDDKTGELPSLLQCIKRYAIFLLVASVPVSSVPLLAVALSAIMTVSCVWVAFDKKKQGLFHDKLAGTVVIKVNKKSK